MRGVGARTSFTKLVPGCAEVVDASEADLRRRTAGKHVEVASVVVERLDLPKEIAEAMRRRVEARLQP